MGLVILFRARGDELERLDVDANTLDEATLKTGHGIYTVFRIFEGRRVLRIERHLQRMRRSAELADQPYLADDTWLRSMTRQAVIAGESSGIVSPRVRLTVPFDAPDSAIIALEPYAPPAADLYETGVAVGLVSAHRDAPRVKSSRFIERRTAFAAEQPHAYYEIMLCAEDGTILEGTGSNFYAVLGGTLCTADEGMLPGIARGMVLEVAEGVIPIRLISVNRTEIPNLSEAMLSSSTRGLLPIVRIDDQVVGDGTPGAVYRALKQHYDALVERELEPL